MELQSINDTFKAFSTRIKCHGSSTAVNRVNACCFHPNGDQLVCALDAGLLILKAVHIDDPIGQWQRQKIPELQTSAVLSCDWNEDGTVLGLGRRNRGVVFLKDGNQLCDTKGTDTVQLIRWNRKGAPQMLLVVSGSLITVWNFSSLNTRQRMPIHCGSVNGVEWISDDLFVSCSFARIHLSRVGYPKPIRSFHIPDKVVWSVRYHAETQLLIAAYTYRLFHNSKNCDTISVWSLTEKECKQKLTDHQNSVYCISCLETNKSVLKEALVASGSSDQTIGIWSLTDPSYSRILHGHVAPIKDVVFAPNGRFLASIDTSGFLLVWCTQTWETIFSGNTSRNQSGHRILWDPTSHKLAVAQLTGFVEVIEIREKQLYSEC